MTTHHCLIRDEQITVEDCAGIVCNATSDQLAKCMECAHGKARRGTSPLAATPRVEPTAKAEAPAQAAPPAATERPPVEVLVQVAESVTPAETAAAPAPLAGATPWERVHSATGLSQNEIARAIHRSQSTVCNMFKRLASGKPYRGQLLDEICAHCHLDKSEILRGGGRPLTSSPAGARGSAEAEATAAAASSGGTAPGAAHRVPARTAARRDHHPDPVARSSMHKIMKPGRKYFVINTDEPYASDVYAVMKNGQMAKGAWPEGDITFEEWMTRTWPPQPERGSEFEDAMRRIHEVAGTRTQVQLAAVLDVRQSSISDAKRRRSIPDGWLLTLLRLFHVNPEWIKDGAGPRYLRTEH